MKIHISIIIGNRSIFNQQIGEAIESGEVFPLIWTRSSKTGKIFRYPGNMGFKKASGKGRLDKYYKLAKEKGYRARSAFKLVQLNEKFKFLHDARVLIDLCAAPGGWLQVAVENMPLSHVIIGVDLDAIKPIKGVATFKCDITTQKCRSDLKKELKGWKADVVLHDGAPNVGSSWDKDAHNQNELVISSLKLASEFLREGGIFVTKVFRSINYLKLINLFEKIFDKVDSTKPASSRNVSAEIFVVCRGFKGLNNFSSELMDPKVVFADTELEQTKFSLLSKEKKNRSGYQDGLTLLYREISLTDFINLPDPESVLCTHNAITFSSAEYEKFLKDDPKCTDLTEIFGDLKIVSKKDLHSILKWLKKLKIAQKAANTTSESIHDDVLPNVDADPLEMAEAEEKKLVREKSKRQKKALQKIRKSQENSITEIGKDFENSEISSWFSTNVSSKIIASNAIKEDGFDLPEQVEIFEPLKIDPIMASYYSSFSTGEKVDASFNRFSRSKKEDDHLPDWFLEDEKAHSGKQIPITKEEADKIRTRIKEDKLSLPKKVLEARARNKLKALRKLDSLKKKASILDESERLEDKEKLRTILSNIYKKQSISKKKKIIVAKGKLKGLKGRPGGVKGRYKMVDSRMRKDMRNNISKKK